MKLGYFLKKEEEFDSKVNIILMKIYEFFLLKHYITKFDQKIWQFGVPATEIGGYYFMPINI